jgi:hypothetical protein
MMATQAFIISCNMKKWTDPCCVHCTAAAAAAEPALGDTYLLVHITHSREVYPIRGDPAAFLARIDACEGIMTTRV